MDPFSITASSVGLATAALKATKSITDFVVAVRSAKADLTGVKGELIALQDVLEGVQQSCSTVETGITSVSCERIEKLMQNCHGVIDKIEALLQRHQSSRLGPAIKWTLTGKEDARKLRDELEAHRDALAIALDLAHLEISQSISTDTGTLVVDAAVIRVNTEQIMDKLEYLQDRILRSHAGGATLERYLDEMTECAASVAGDVRKATKVRMSRASDVEVLSTLEQTVPGSDDEASVDNVEEPVQEQSWFDRMRSYQEALESQNARAAQDQASMRLLFMTFGPLVLTILLFILPEEMIPFRQTPKTFVVALVFVYTFVYSAVSIVQCLSSSEGDGNFVAGKMREIYIGPINRLLRQQRQARADMEMAMVESNAPSP